jgi:hypothetical protein
LGKNALTSAQNPSKEGDNFWPLIKCPFCQLIIGTRQEQIDLSTVKSRVAGFMSLKKVPENANNFGNQRRQPYLWAELVTRAKQKWRTGKGYSGDSPTDNREAGVEAELVDEKTHHRREDATALVTREEVDAKYRGAVTF